MTRSCNCGHGWSWHIEWISKFDWGGERLINKVIPCTKEGCNCERYQTISKEQMPVIQASWGDWSPEQIKLNEELKEKTVPGIQVTKDFHELFCRVLKQETNRECDCEGTTSEIRAKK